MIALSPPAVLRAQAPSYFHALTVPPGDAGTCLDAPHAPVGRGKLYLRARLVMTSRGPDARREMTLLRDSGGAVVAFNETVHLSTGRLASVGENVIASLHPDGRVVGYRLHSQMEMADNGVARVDTASLRRMRESGKLKSSRELLDADEQGRVRVLAAWLAKRCPS